MWLFQTLKRLVWVPKLPNRWSIWKTLTLNLLKWLVVELFGLGEAGWGQFGLVWVGLGRFGVA